MGIVVVVGAVNVDMVVTASTLPGPGETVVGPSVERHGGGKGANAAVAAARAGARVRYVGAVGADDLGRESLDQLRAEGISVVDVAVLDDVPTGVALIVVDAEGENQIAVGQGANAAVDPSAVRAAVRAAGADCVLVSTEIPDAAVAAAVEEAAAAGVRCVLNPAPVIPVVTDLLAHGPLLTPNAGELRALTGSSDADAARDLARRTGAPVVVTLGGDGVLVADPAAEPAAEVGSAVDNAAGDPEVEHVAALPTTVRDTTGAGDTFNGVLAARLAEGDDLAEAVRWANAAAALSVAQPGARGGMPTADVIAALLADGSAGPPDSAG